MPPQNLKDILGQTGDFQYTFAVKDLITPAVESIDQAAHALVRYFDKQTKRIDKSMGKGFAAIRSFLNKDVKQARREVKEVASGFDDIEQEAKQAGKAVSSTGDGFETLGRLMRTLHLDDKLDGLKGQDFFKVADEWGEDMAKLARGLGTTRQEVAGLAETVIAGVTSHSMFAASARDAMNAMEGLHGAGVREKKTFEELGPLVAITANAMNADVAKVSEGFFILTDRMEISKERVSDVFADWQKVTRDTSASMTEMQDTFLNPEFYTDFARLTEGLSEEAKAQMLSSLGNIRGVLDSSWADSGDFIKKIVTGLSDPTKMSEVARMTGMNAETVKEMLQTQEGTALFLEGLLQNAEQYRGLAPEMLKSLDENFGLAEGSLLALQKNSEYLKTSLAGLHKNATKAGDGVDHLVSESIRGIGSVKEFGRAISSLAAKQIPLLGMSFLDISSFMGDLPWMEVASAVFIGQWIAGLTVVQTMWAGVAVEMGLVSSLFGILSTAAMGVVTAVAPWLLLAGAVYLVYQNAEMLSAPLFKIYDFLLGTGPLEEGWLGTLQGVLRILLTPVRLLKDGLIFLGSMIPDLLAKFMGFESAATFVDQMAASFQMIKDTVSWLIDNVTRLGAVIKDALVSQVNSGLIDPLNQKINTVIPFTNGKTMGSVMGLQEIPRLGDGGILMEPTIAEVAEKGPEAAIPLEDYDRLLLAARGVQMGSMREGPGPTPPAVNVNQERVVAALVDLKNTLVEMMRRSDLPQRGSGFGLSPAASPRGF